MHRRSQGQFEIAKSIRITSSNGEGSITRTDTQDDYVFYVSVTGVQFDNLTITGEKLQNYKNYHRKYNN